MKDQIFDVVVRADGPDHFTAHPVAFPEMKAEAGTETEVVRKVRESLVELLSTSKVVQVSVPGANPWLRVAGHAADNPDFEEYLEEIRKARLEYDES